MARLGRSYPAKARLSKLLQSSSGNIYSDSVTEAAVAADAESVTAAFAATDTEAGTATDSNSASAVFAASDTEAATATDVDGGGYTVAQSETASATETEAAGATYPVSTSEAGSASDAESASAVFVSSDSESVSASDADAGAAAYPVAASESGTAADSSDGALGSQTYSVSVTEAASATDTVTSLGEEVRVGGGGWFSYDRREIQRVVDAYHHKRIKNKKAKKAVENAIEVLEKVAGKGILSDLVPELAETIETLPVNPMPAVIQDIRQLTSILERVLADEEEEELMFIVWALG